MLSIFKKNTVASILSEFHKAVSQLQDLADKRLREAADKHAKVHDLMVEIEEAEEEAQQAVEAAENIGSLIGNDSYPIVSAL